MIVIARMGGIEIIADDERTDQTPTPEWIEDTAKRLSRIALETYIALPDGVTVEPIASDGDDD